MHGHGSSFTDNKTAAIVACRKTGSALLPLWTKLINGPCQTPDDWMSLHFQTRKRKSRKVSNWLALKFF